MVEISETQDAVVFVVKVIPRSSKSEVVREFNGALKVKLTAPTVEGAANKELVKLLAKTFRVSKSRIKIIGGKTSRTKRVQIDDLTAKEFFQDLRSLRE